MIVTLFRTRLREDADRQEYGATARHLLGIAQEMPGFVSFDTYTSRDGETLSVVVFASAEALEAWRVQPDHLVAQRRGREEFYDSYSFQVCELGREFGWEREGAGAS